MAVCAAIVLAPRLVEAKPHAVGSPGVEELRAEYAQLSTAFAATVSGWRPERPASGSLLFVAPDEYTGTKAIGEQFRTARNTYAEALFALAKQAAEVGQLSLAFEWATEAVRENPDHAEARRVLGYELVDGEWLTPVCETNGRRRQVVESKSWLDRG